MKKMRIRTKKMIVLLIAILMVLPCIVSCGGRKYRFDPGFFEINTDNYKKYLKINIKKGEDDFSTAVRAFKIDYKIESRDELQYMDCFVTIKFIANEGSVVEKISLSEEGTASGSVSVTFEAAYTVQYSYEIVDVSGSMYDNGKEDGFPYIDYNNIRYMGRSKLVGDIDSPNRTYRTVWEPEYKVRNNTETLYFTDTIYTKSGTAIEYDASGVFNPRGLVYWNLSPLSNVTTVIFDGSLEYSEFASMGWSYAHSMTPNLKIVYIKNLIDDGASIGYNMALPTSGVDFYIGGDFEQAAEYLSDVEFVSSINHANDFDISNYEKDNK